MNVLEIIWLKYWSYRLLVKCRRNYVINKDERDMVIEKKLKDRTRIRVYGFYSWLKLQSCLLIGGDHWIWKRGNYLTA